MMSSAKVSVRFIKADLYTTMQVKQLKKSKPSKPALVVTIKLKECVQM